MASIPIDVEKTAEATARISASDVSQKNETGTTSSVAVPDDHEVHIPAPNKLRQLNNWIEGLSGFEARGITRVQPEERNPPSLWDDVSVALLWFSANISMNNLAVGLFGPAVFGLGFLDSAMCAVFGSLLGALSTAYMSIWGPQSGNRTMVSPHACVEGPPGGAVDGCDVVRVLTSINISPGCAALLHGLLAGQNPDGVEHHSHGTILASRHSC
jgi:hypothetical protein